LESVDDKNINALEHQRTYQNIIKRDYSKKIMNKEFMVSDLVLKKNHHKTKAKRGRQKKF